MAPDFLNVSSSLYVFHYSVSEDVNTVLLISHLPALFFEHLCHSHLDFNASLLPPVLENCGHEVFNLAAEILSLQY